LRQRPAQIKGMNFTAAILYAAFEE
jgi:hypothetical protein